VQKDVRRVEAMWADCRTRFGQGGPFLFGAFCAADAMYAPVVSRVHTYDIDVASEAQAYMQAVMALPAWIEWEKAARAEPWILPHVEVDWPQVLRA
jgi:glutathione S-transferase